MHEKADVLRALTQGSTQVCIAVPPVWALCCTREPWDMHSILTHNPIPPPSPSPTADLNKRITEKTSHCAQVVLHGNLP